MTVPDPQSRRELLAEAARIVVGSQFGSPSTLQRKLRITFAEARGLMDELERYRIVGPAAGTQTREVLAPPDQLGDVLDQIRGGA